MNTYVYKGFPLGINLWGEVLGKMAKIWVGESIPLLNPPPPPPPPPPIGETHYGVPKSGYDSVSW